MAFVHSIVNGIGMGIGLVLAVQIMKVVFRLTLCG